jgi:hypothetical protein
VSAVSEYFEIRPLIDISEIKADKALETLRILESGVLPFARLIEVRASNNTDVLIVEVEPELPQRRVYPIQYKEVLAIEFDQDDQNAPWVFALRDDFPIVPHLNLMPKEFPRSLCLYEESYRQQKRYWTAPKFVEDIRRWLSLTAQGRLHDDDQPLEPMILNSHIPIILSEDLLELGTEGVMKLIISGIGEGDKITALTAKKGIEEIPPWKAGGHLGLVLTCPSQQHGTIRHQPSNLTELHELCAGIGFDLQKAVEAFLLDIRQDTNALDYPMILVMQFPKLRHQGGAVEALDRYAFWIRNNLRQIGEDLGLWQSVTSLQHPGVLIQRDLNRKGQKIDLFLLNVHFQLSRKQAAIINGFNQENNIKIVAIGAGALGSQIITNLTRAGFGKWTIIDNDIALPHNFARHAMFMGVGFPKAIILTEHLHYIMPNDHELECIVTDVLNPEKDIAEKLNHQLKDAELILDLSASINVARYLSHQSTYSGRRISLFLNPSGSDLVCLAEDVERRISLDQLEVQYYRAILENTELANHLNNSKRLRYGQTCRDLSATIPQDYVALFAGIGSRAVHKLCDQPNAAICIWSLNPNDLSVHSISPHPLQMKQMQLGEWRLLTDNKLIDKVFKQRTNSLPKETGGILIGAWDKEHKIVYVIDIIPAPFDSVERETTFIRGHQGLSDQVRVIEEKTNWELGYVGEWHSHPNGVSCLPSTDDLEILTWLERHMGEVGLPSLMMIACDKNLTHWFLGNEHAVAS